MLCIHAFRLGVRPRVYSNSRSRIGIDALPCLRKTRRHRHAGTPAGNEKAIYTGWRKGVTFRYSLANKSEILARVVIDKHCCLLGRKEIWPSVWARVNACAKTGGNVSGQGSENAGNYSEQSEFIIRSSWRMNSSEFEPTAHTGDAQEIQINQGFLPLNLPVLFPHMHSYPECHWFESSRRYHLSLTV